ncbi:MAG: bifunctional 4-hydroxy-2-oxoglutarate aldolase/2-dehydro-3-deoxy-phosphogluconate aldolase [Anaerolineaceae bacterium]
MSKHNRMSVLNTIYEVGFIPLFYYPDVDTSCKIIEACLAGGAHAIEFTNRGDRAHLVFQEVIKLFENDPRLYLGAGSVIDPGTASLYMQLGAEFIVGPMLSEEVAYTCNLRKIPYMPGCGSVTEISRAESLGVEICKVFPGESVGGPSFIKSVKGPMPWTSLMPTGGVEPTQENLSKWFSAGVACVGMGSNLIGKKDVEDKNFAAITEKVKNVVEILRVIRNK